MRCQMGALSTFLKRREIGLIFILELRLSDFVGAQGALGGMICFAPVQGRNHSYPRSRQ